eukprot:m.186789 g.186789  ORF g.186789 m.186789 type:complete len:521 (+) comp32281_c0_seq2:110-1672(+)
MYWYPSLWQTCSRVVISTPKTTSGFPRMHAYLRTTKLLGARLKTTDNGGDENKESAVKPTKKTGKRRVRSDYHVYGTRKETERTSTLWMKEHFGVAKDTANALAISVPFLCQPTIPDNGCEVVKVLLAHNLNVAKIFATAWSTMHIPAEQVDQTLHGLKNMGFTHEKIALLIESQPGILAFPLDETAFDLSDKLGLQVHAAVVKDIRARKKLRRGSKKQEAAIIANRKRLKGLQIDIEKVTLGYENLLRQPVETLEKKLQFLQGKPLFLTSEQQISIIHRQTQAFINLDVDEAKLHMTKLLTFVTEDALALMICKSLAVLKPSQTMFLDILVDFGIDRRHITRMLTAQRRWTRGRTAVPTLKLKSGVSEERQWRDGLKVKYTMLRHFFDHDETLHQMGQEGCILCLLPSVQISKFHVRLKLLEKCDLISSTSINTLNALGGTPKPISTYVEASAPKFATLVGASVEYLQEFHFYYLELYMKKESMISGISENEWINIHAVSKADLDAIPLPNSRKHESMS